MKRLLTTFLFGAFALYMVSAFGQKADMPPVYTCLKISQPIEIDGKPDEAAWQGIPWTDAFVDIKGEAKPLPYRKTRVKMCWDNQYFYVAAELEEPHLWATYDQRDMVIFHENDFEVFIDPTGDTHHYYELEINALGTIWDLMLTKPYRDGGKAIDDWDIRGLKSAVHLQGTLNDPSDEDKGWTVELAFPWKSLEEVASHNGAPNPGEIWRVNFSRVHWRIKPENGTYVKELNPASGKSLPEYNWVWAPQGVIAMHQPETWGLVSFQTSMSGKPDTARLSKGYSAQMLLRSIYSQQRAFREKEHRFAEAIELSLPRRDMTVTTYPGGYVASLRIEGELWCIREDGKIWIHPTTNK